MMTIEAGWGWRDKYRPAVLISRVAKLNSTAHALTSIALKPSSNVVRRWSPPVPSRAMN